jgi:CrcB protein
MKMVLAVAVGGGAGALARYYFAALVGAVMGTAFPWAILVVNVVGCFLMGVVVELTALKLNLSPEMRAFLTTGVLGGFTTFSAFSLDASLLIERGEWGASLAYILASVLFSIMALFAGLMLVRAL